MQDVLSPSQLVMFQRCGERWRRRYLEEELTPPGLSLHVGRAVREAAEACLRHRQASGEVMAEQDALDVAAAAYAASLEEGVHHAPEDEADAAHAEEEGRNTVLTLTSLFVKELAPTLDPVLTAPSVTLDLGLELPVAVTLGCVTADGAARRLSTASRRWSAERAHGAPEAALWPEAVRALTGKAPTSLVFDVLVHTKTPALQSIETERTAEDLEAVVRQFSLMLASIRAGIFPPAAPDTWSCTPRWCPYFHSCAHVSARRKALPLSLRHAVSAAGEKSAA